MWVGLTDGRTLGAPLAWFPRLKNGLPEERAAVTFSAFGLHWEALDEDISDVDLQERSGSLGNP